MPMNENDLVPGDVIFFVNVYKEIPNNEPDDDIVYEPQQYVDHVGMFVGYDEDHNPRIVHSITGSKGHYYPEKVSGLCITTLRTLQNQEENGRIYDVQYRVFRGAFPVITAKALEVLKQQATYRIPYDEQRLKKKLDLEEKMDGDDFKEMGINAYSKSGIFRSIKYAARHPFLFTRTRGDGVGRGLTCSMSVILAYQIAELLLDNKITPINPSLNEWPSDKYATVPEGSLSETYRSYLAGLKTPMTVPRTQEGVKLSINFWKGAQRPEEYRHKTFAVDCKCIGAEGMFLYMRDSKDAWSYLGDLNVAKRVFSPTDKAQHKSKLIDAYRSFLGNVSGMVRALPVMCSPARSPSPVPEGKGDLWWKKEDISTRIFYGAPAINKEDFIILHDSTLIRESLAKVAQQLLTELPRVQVLSMLGMLLNTQVVRNVFIPRSAMTQLPTFYSSQALCYQDISTMYQLHSFTKEGKLSARPTIKFYPGETNLYGTFTKIVFEQCIMLINKESEEQKELLVKALVAKGRDLFKQGNYFDAMSMYLSAQLAYCLLNNPTIFMHQQFMQLFLLRIQAYEKIKATTPTMAQLATDSIEGEKKKGLDTLDLLAELIPPEIYAPFEACPVVAKVKSFKKDASLDAFLNGITSSTLPKK